MIKMTCGPGWSLISDDEPELTKKINPKSPKPKIRLEKRRGKTITVISGLHTYGSQKLDEISKELKISCGTGGTVKNGNIEIQGDKSVQVQEYFNRQTGDK